MKWVKASGFKTDCVRLADEASIVVVVKRGVPVGAYAPPLPGKRFRPGENLGGIRIIGDIVSPMHELWEGWDEKFDRINRRRP
ncbi:MAG: hypothetical protein ABL996_13865 [Micropepsaceae bacterium]